MSHVYDEASKLCYKIDELLRFNDLQKEEYNLLDQADKFITQIIECKGDWVYIGSDYMDWEKTCSHCYGYNDAISDVAELLENSGVDMKIILELDKLRLEPKEWGVE